MGGWQVIVRRFGRVQPYTDRDVMCRSGRSTEACGWRAFLFVFWATTLRVTMADAPRFALLVACAWTSCGTGGVCLTRSVPFRVTSSTRKIHPPPPPPQLWVRRALSSHRTPRWPAPRPGARCPALPCIAFWHASNNLTHCYSSPTSCRCEYVYAVSARARDELAAS